MEQASNPENEGEEDDEDQLLTNTAIIGELGLVTGHKFIYFFDYGDSHEFQVELVSIKPRAGKGRYPRVVEKQGKAPRQYGNWW